MRFLSELYALIIGPIELVFEIIFSVLNKHIHISGLNIMLLSLVFSLIVLPLYTVLCYEKEKGSCEIQNNQGDPAAGRVPS